jgi:ElaA protein
MDFIIKNFNELTVGELYEILELRINIFVVEQDCPYPEIDGKDKQAMHLFVREERKIIAYLRILPRGVSFDEVSFGRVVVDKKHRRKGLAKALLERAIQYTQEEMREAKVRIEAQSYTRGLYESVGFIKISEEFIMDRLPHIEMLLDLTKQSVDRSLTPAPGQKQERK